jgi:hypothetical protein
MAKTGPKLFTCPKCRRTYLGHEPLPDCPHCGYDYKEKEGLRWDVVFYLLVIIALMSFALTSSYYRNISAERTGAAQSGGSQDGVEKLPGGSRAPFQSPYHEPGR